MCLINPIYINNYGNTSRTAKMGMCFWAAAAICLTLFLTPKSAFADVELEQNDNLGTANPFVNGQTIYGQLSSDTDVDWYYFKGKMPDEIPLAFQCNQAGYYFYYYNPYFYTVSAYNGSGSLISSFKIPLSFCSSNGGNAYTMHLNGTAAGATSISISALLDTNSCPYCFYYGFPNYTSEYSFYIVRPGTAASVPTLTTKTGRVVKDSEIKKDVRRHADTVNIMLRGCKDDKVNTSIIIKGDHLKLAEITPKTNIALEIGNWRCDATGTWDSSLYPTGTDFKATKPK